MFIYLIQPLILCCCTVYSDRTSLLLNPSNISTLKSGKEGLLNGGVYLPAVYIFLTIGG